MTVFSLFAKPPVFDTNASGAGNFGALPEWDLRDLYMADDAPEVTRDMAWLAKAGRRAAKSCIRGFYPRFI